MPRSETRRKLRAQRANPHACWPARIQNSVGHVVTPRIECGAQEVSGRRGSSSPKDPILQRPAIVRREAHAMTDAAKRPIGAHLGTGFRQRFRYIVSEERRRGSKSSTRNREITHEASTDCKRRRLGAGGPGIAGFRQSRTAADGEESLGLGVADRRLRQSALQQIGADQQGQRRRSQGRLDVLDGRPARPRGRTLGDRQHDVRAHALSEQGLCPRPEQRRRDQVEVRAEAGS